MSRYRTRPAPKRAAIRDALSVHGPCTAHELADAMGWRRSAVAASLSRMRQIGVGPRIVRWDRVDPGQPVAVYAFTPGRDVPKPAPVPLQERQRKWLEKRRAVVRLAKRIEQSKRTGYTPRAATWLSGLGG